jgi:hypothetical protein
MEEKDAEATLSVAYATNSGDRVVSEAIPVPVDLPGECLPALGQAYRRLLTTWNGESRKDHTRRGGRASCLSIAMFSVSKAAADGKV